VAGLEDHQGGTPGTSKQITDTKRMAQPSGAPRTGHRTAGLAKGLPALVVRC
jgi:hypothetical protein